MAKARTIGHWRHIDGDRLAQRVKSLPLGSEESVETSEIRGEPWMKRIDLITRNPRKTADERWTMIREEYKQEEEHNEKISKEIEKRREAGHPFGV